MSIRTILCALQTYPYPGPWVPQKRDDKTALTIIVVVVAILIIVPIILSAVLYFMVSGLIGAPPDDHRPGVQLGDAEPSAGNVWRVTVAYVSHAEPLFQFRIILYEDVTLRSEMNPLAEGTFGNLSFFDLDGGGTLSAGDFFSVTCNPESEYELTVIWRESGNLMAYEYWRT